MAVMARIVGIPARVAIGFLEPADLGDGNWEYGSRDLAHLSLAFDILTAGKSSRLFKRLVYRDRIASDVVAKGGASKPEADAVTRGMTASVVACTLWVVGWELVTVLVVFRL